MQSLREIPHYKSTPTLAIRIEITNDLSLNTPQSPIQFNVAFCAQFRLAVRRHRHTRMGLIHWHKDRIAINGRARCKYHLSACGLGELQHIDGAEHVSR